MMGTSKYTNELNQTYGSAKDYLDMFLHDGVISFELLVQPKNNVFDVSVSYYGWEKDVLAKEEGESSSTEFLAENEDEKLSVDFVTKEEALAYAEALKQFLSHVRPVSVSNEMPARI